MDDAKKIYIGGDALGHDLKEKVKSVFGDDIVDLGVFNGDDKEFSVMAREVAEKVREGDENTFGILVFGKGSKCFGGKEEDESSGA